METNERPHAEISSSTVGCALKCAGSVVLRRSLPHLPPSEAMLSGTKTHDIAEKALENYIQHKITGSPPWTILEELEGDPEREARVVDYVSAVFNKALQGSITGKAYGIEEKLTVSETFKMFGYADFWAAYKDDRARLAGLVVDLKDGQVKVDVKKTEQLPFLALGLMRDLEKTGVKLDYVRAAIYQARGREGEEYQETKYTRKQLESFESKVLKLCEQIYLKKKITYKAGKWCGYCRCKEICPTYAGSLQNKTSLMLLEPSEIKFPAPELIPDEVLAKIILNWSEIESFGKAVKKHAFMRHINGKPIAGLKAVEGNSKRRIDKSKEAEIIAFFGERNITSWEPKLKGIGKLSAELKKIGEDKNLVDQFCTKGPPPIMLVSDTDPRPAAKNSIDYLIEDEDEESD